MREKKTLNINKGKEEVESWLKDYFKNKGSYNKKIYEAMSYSLNIGGKRIRPILTILTYDMFEDNYEEILPVCGALEMIHTYSLIHDDLPCMDNDDLRRGKPTNHKVFGEGLAVLAGDGLLNEALNILFKLSLKEDRKWAKAALLIGEASGVEGMIGGQTVDILSENEDIPKDKLHYIHSKKTGALIKASILAGAILGKSTEKEYNILNEFGEKLGLAFQIKDDILDIIGDSTKIGKTAKKDIESNKSTFVKLYGLEESKQMCLKLTEECLELLNKIDKNTESLEKLTLILLKREY
ncbi:polyprenyl synthetase family protein [Clostridium sp. HMP27]|uniref:polyprenyl synthetase family protein n=1 Tax=Clostridium sp. HMP27 TaxID=1487921 RepID=UPI00052C8D04|nr:farnesyl diphosphate synthase [Clostridium sp. HMP27]KGK89044.1 farnesyl-diphosphate synthase [Clostridium sp. HMP27]